MAEGTVKGSVIPPNTALYRMLRDVPHPFQGAPQRITGITLPLRYAPGTTLALPARASVVAPCPAVRGTTAKRPRRGASGRAGVMHPAPLRSTGRSQPDGGESARFRGIFLALSFIRFGGESHPAHSS